MTNPDTKDAELLKELAKITTPAAMSASDFKFRGLLYGDPGAGKTDLGIKLANALGDRICLLSSDSAWTTILNYPDIVSKVTRIPFGGLSTINTILKARDAGVEPYCSFDVLMWDTVSKSADMVLRNLVKARPSQSPKVPKEMEEYSHYRLLEIMFRELMPKLMNSNLHIIYTAHLRYPKEKDLEQGKVAIRPAFPEATFQEVSQESNLVGYMFKNDSGGQRFIQLSGTKTETAKCQVPGIIEKTYPVQDIVPLLEAMLNKENSE